MKVKNWTTGEIKECDTMTYCNDMDIIVECPECGKRVTFGSLYNSGDWFEPKGVWRVGICEECAKKHWKQEEEKENKQD